MNITPGKLWGLRRLADADGYWRMIATDQRELFAGVVSGATGNEPADYSQTAEIVSRIATDLQDEATAVLLDPIYGYLNTVRRLQASKGLLLSLESLDMQRSGHGIKTGPIPGWSVAKIRHLGADGVKLLVLYRADDEPDSRQHQEDFVERTGRECADNDIPLLLEVLIHQHEGEADDDFLAQRGALTVAAVNAFKDTKFGVDIYKLPPPGPLSGVPEPGTPAGDQLQDVYHRMVRDLPAPWVLLSAAMNKQDFRRSLEFAYGAAASGYLAGRAVWSQAPLLYPSFDAITASLRTESAPYLQQLNELTVKSATPWHQHPTMQPVELPYELDRDFGQHYQA